MPVPKLVATAVMMAANMAMTALQTTEGPRLTDTKATVADYGTPCNNFIGTRMLPAHCIFAKPIEEKKKKRKGKGGKQVSYTGYGTFAVQIAEHAIDDVLQIYFDNHLVYDATGGGEAIYPLADDYDLESHMRFHLGAEDQEPDPDMLAYIEARDGPGTCPAYRGQATIYFERIPLEQLGNRLPTVMVLARNGGGAAEATVPTQYTTEWIATLDVPLPSWETAAEADLLGANLSFTFSANVPYYWGPTDPSTGLAIIYWEAYTDEIVAGQWEYLTYSDIIGHTPENAPPDPVIVAWMYDPDGSPTVTVRSWYGQWNFQLTEMFVQGSTETQPTGTFAMALTQSNNGAAHAELTVEEGGAGRIDYTEDSLDPPAAVSERRDRWISTNNNEYNVEYVSEASDAVTLATLLTGTALRGGLTADQFDFSLVAGEEYTIPGYSWTQGTGRQVCEPVCDLFDVDLRPHDLVLQALPRGSEPAGAITSDEFAANDDAPYRLPSTADEDLPRRVFLTFADTGGGQEPNTAQPMGGPDLGASGSAGEMTIDMSTLALDATTAQQLVERRQRRERFARIDGEFGLTRRRIGIEPGDVWTPEFDGLPLTMRCTKLTIGADGVLASEWKRDEPRLAVLPGSEGAAMAGWIAPTIPTGVSSVGEVLDLPLLIDAHEQTAPLAYLSAGPAEPGVWTGADFAASDTGELDSYLEGWDGIASGDGAMIGTVAEALPDVDPWVPDYGSTITVTINQGELTSATLDELLLDSTLNLAAIRSGAGPSGGWELVQFMTPTLVGSRQYALSGFLRGVRGSEWAIGGHAPGDAFVLLDGTVKRRSMGAGEIGDSDWYVISTTGQAVDQATAFELAYTGASHKPYAPVHGTVEQSGADWLFGATRRTRIGGATLDGQDVPLGQASESWSLDVMDGAAVVRTITGTALPLTYAEADQITDWGAPLSAPPEANLHQVDPVLNLRGYPLNFPEGTP